MPGKVKVKILAGRNLPVMDRSSDTTDAYVEVKLGNTTYKTDVCRKSLNPTWDSDWYRYEVDDSELQDEPLQIRLMDHDTYSANDSIGKVYLALNPLLLPAVPPCGKSASGTDGAPNSGPVPGGSVFSGWIPVFDTMHGIRGEVNIIVKVELFSDFNKFRQSSCGVQFFCSPTIPSGYHAQVIHGFVEELVVNDDPEYQWIDKIRTPRASNEARQTLFFKLSGEVQRKIGLKALDLGGNAVIGYHQCFDLEGESGIVVRGIGTAVTLSKLQDIALPPSAPMDTPPVDDSGMDSPGLVEVANGCTPTSTPAPATTPSAPRLLVVPASRDASPCEGPAPAPPRLGASLSRVLARMKGIRGGGRPAGGQGAAAASRWVRPRDRLARAFRLLPLGKKLRSRLAAVSDAPRPRSCSDSRRERPRSRPRPGLGRCASESVAAAALDRVVEVRESPGSSPPSPRLPPPVFLRLPRGSPSLRYVDGHLVSNTSSGVSSSSSSDSSDVSDEPTPPRRPSLRLFSDFAVQRRLPLSSESVNEVFTDASGGTSPTAVPAPPPPPVLSVTATTPAEEAGPPDPPPSPPSPSPLHAPVEPRRTSEVVVVLHKSRSAASLRSRTPHATNALKHGPCLLPPSRQPQAQPEDADRPPASPPPTAYALGAAAPGASASAALAAIKVSPSPAKLCSLPGICRRSSDSDLSITPKGNSLTGSDRSSTTGLRQQAPLLRPALNQEGLDMMEYPFLTMCKYPPGFIVNIGGAVTARSVKLLERISNLEEPESRDTWWTELRMEIRSHARALACNVVLGYAETTSICDDVCVLSASGTAAVVSLVAELGDGSAPHALARMQPPPPVPPPPPGPPPTQPPAAATAAATAAAAPGGPPTAPPSLLTTSLDRSDFDRDRLQRLLVDTSVPLSTQGKARPPPPPPAPDGAESSEAMQCTLCHLPYAEGSMPMRTVTLRCAMCRRASVPELLVTTIEPPDGAAVVGRGGLLQAYVCRPKRDCRGELNAKEISDGLPFLEYDLHRALCYKLKLRGMNAIFGLRVQVTIGDRLMLALATGTAAFLAPLPTPMVPKVSAGNSWTDEKQLAETQRQVQDAVKRSREAHLLRPAPDPAPPASDTEDSEDDLPDLELTAGNKDTCVFEIDDAEDMDVVAQLLDPLPPPGFVACTTEVPPGLEEQDLTSSVHMFTRVWRSKLLLAQLSRNLNTHFLRLLQGTFFKLRRATPCALCRMQFRIELPEPDEIQISVLGMALGLSDFEKPLPSRSRRKLLAQSSSKELLSRKDDGDMIFSLEEDQVAEAAPSSATPSASSINPAASSTSTPNVAAPTPAPRAPAKALHALRLSTHASPKERFGIDITPLSFVPGGRIERYLGNLNFFFIRESTSIRETGGLSGFVHSFVTEVLAIVRSHVTALGGNAMVAYFMSECVLYHNPHKNQGQCLINVGGDVVLVAYDD